MRGDGKVELVCEQCGGTFLCTPYRAKTARYCSRQCRTDHGHVTRNCEHCGKEFSAYRSMTNPRRYCSTECGYAAKRGDPELKRQRRLEYRLQWQRENRDYIRKYQRRYYRDNIEKWADYYAKTYRRRAERQAEEERRISEEMERVERDATATFRPYADDPKVTRKKRSGRGTRGRSPAETVALRQGRLARTGAEKAEEAEKPNPPFRPSPALLAARRLEGEQRDNR